MIALGFCAEDVKRDWPDDVDLEALGHSIIGSSLKKTITSNPFEGRCSHIGKISKIEIVIKCQYILSVFVFSLRIKEIT